MLVTVGSAKVDHIPSGESVEGQKKSPGLRS